MKIGLIDVDGHNFPNLALMKISAYHKQRGDDVEWHMATQAYDKVYMSKIFDASADYATCINANEIIQGGRAYDKKKVLPLEIETMCPDYSLYRITDTAYGYLTRGCPRACAFCDVVNIEGRKSRKVADLSQFWNGQKIIKLLDPNLLASKKHMELLQQLVDSKAWVDITQGLDVRLVSQENIRLIKSLKIERLHFAWDNPSDNLVERFKMCKEETGLPCDKLIVYVLTNFNSTHEQDLHRVYALKELGFNPYIMIFADDNKYVPKGTRRLQRWVNNRRIFKTCDRFDNYESRHASKKHQLQNQIEMKL